jgi:hypothetical protein
MSTLTTLYRLVPMKAVLTASALGLLLTACASTPPPMANEQNAAAQVAVQRANTTDTIQNAPQELQVATAKLLSAREALASGNALRASQLAEQAQVDARRAEVHAQSETARKEAQESQDAAQALRDEINRNGSRMAPKEVQ